MKRSLESMMTAVGNGVSKKSANFVEDAWNAIQRVERGDGLTVTMAANDHALVYKYMRACAKKAGVI
jgi:hypothetical protein